MIKLADGRGLLYQWDTGRQVECDAEQVHFSNHHYGTSIDVNVQGGKATIPNQLLTSATPIKAWAWVKDSNGEYTKEEQIFAVAKRNKPSDYVYTPAEIKTWQDLQNQIGDLNNLTTAHKDNLVNAINDAAGSGGGAGDFIIKMTVESDYSGNYTVTSCDATFEQIDAAYNSDKNIVLKVAASGYQGDFSCSLPVVSAAQVSYYYFCGLDDLYVYLALFTPDYSEFSVSKFSANNITYSNTALPNVKNVKAALDELVSNSHTHNNKGTLDKLSVSNGKLQYNGSDVGLKGADGANGKDGTNGITPTIGANGNWFLGTTDTGKPSHGSDYVLTETDKSEIAALVIEMLGGNPIFGIVDENNNIIVSGNLADGTYTVKYEMEDGSTVDIGNLVLDSNVYYTITNTLTQCTTNNSATQAVGGGSYSATITANSGYELSSVVVTMGGTDITSSAVSGEIINIETVTGDIVITAVAEEIVIVNQIPISTDSSGNLFVGANGEAGYKTDTRLSVSGSEKTQSGHETTGFIPAKYADTIYLKNITITSSTSEVMCFYDSNYAVLVGTYTEFVFGATSGGVVSKKVSDIALDSITTNADKIAFVRISANEINANSVITINQPIS